MPDDEPYGGDEYGMSPREDDLLAPQEEIENTDVLVDQDWSPRSSAAKARWANETYKARALARRRQTLVHKGRGPREKMPRPPLSPSAQKRSDALRERWHDEEAWMRKRLADGAEQRLAINSEEYKLQKQRERAEVARKRAAARKAKKAPSEET